MTIVTKFYKPNEERPFSVAIMDESENEAVEQNVKEWLLRGAGFRVVVEYSR